MMNDAVETHRFEVVGHVDPQTVPRLINFFTQRGLVPRRIQAELAGDQLVVLIEQDGLALWDAQVIVERMRMSVLVKNVSGPPATVAAGGNET